jgi:hypothetical protein
MKSQGQRTAGVAARRAICETARVNAFATPGLVRARNTCARRLHLPSGYG